MSSENPIIKVIQLARQYNVKEVRHYDNLLNTYSSTEQIVNQFFDMTRRSIRQNAENGKSKYRTYLEINPELESPPIYNKLYNRNHVSMIAKLRTSSHNLRIETGRRAGTIREERMCYCGADVDTERHFLLECGLYHAAREKYNISRDMSISSLLNDVHFLGYIKDCMTTRKTFV